MLNFNFFNYYTREVLIMIEKQRTGSLLRQFVEENPLTEESLGLCGDWSWLPERQTSPEILVSVSPSKEYNEN
jgi:hypothetical protein